MNEIQFFCVICGQGLCARLGSAGGFCECPRCLRVVPIPGYPASPSVPTAQAAVYSRDILEIEIKFFCNCCGNKIRADARFQGQKIACPVCHERTKVPAWGGQLPPLAADEKAARTATPVARLSHEECAFLSAPIADRGEALVPAGTP